MKPIHITVLMRDAGQAKAVARALAECGRHALIHVAESPDNLHEADFGPVDALLTDSASLLERPPDCPVVPVGELPLYGPALWAAAEEAALQRRGLGAFFADARGRKPSVLGFFSPWGGCGVTSLAISCGRLLAAGGGRPLYIDRDGRPDAALYGGLYAREGRHAAPDAACTLKELLFRLEHDMPLCLERWVREERYGLRLLMGAAGDTILSSLSVEDWNRVLMQIALAAGADWLLLDLGRMERPAAVALVLDGLALEVRSRREQRCLCADGADAGAAGECLLVWNHDAESGSHTLRDAGWPVFSIRHDPESFAARKGSAGIDLLLSKDYGAGVAALKNFLLTWCENRVEGGGTVSNAAE